ncbi:MAG: PspC domain-containing protein [Candidatus Cryptobacteroides sp.]|nr:PspC domain-containing protein [Candidatus Cryptobacteroides sp.]
MKKLRRIRQGRVLAGVCTGLGEYFDTDPVLFRIIWVLIAIPTAVLGALIAYLVVALLIPSQDKIDYYR